VVGAGSRSLYPPLRCRRNAKGLAVGAVEMAGAGEAADQREPGDTDGRLLQQVTARRQARLYKETNRIR